MSEPARALLGGGIGSGKSSAAAVFAGLGATVLSADEAARAVLAPGGAAAAWVRQRWPEVVSGGVVDRARLAALVFSDAAARAELEAVTHPAVGRLLAARVARVEAPAVVVEMPLPVDLLGPGWRWVVVDAPDETRLARLAARGMSREDAVRRMAAQPSRADWLACADLVVDNGGDLARLAAECLRVWPTLLGWRGGTGG